MTSIPPATTTITGQTASTETRHLLVNGRVQGVGFRPFIYKLAHRLGLSGTVANNDHGVSIYITGPEEKLRLFQESLKQEAPPVAKIERIQISPVDSVPDLSPVEEGTFIILPSSQSGPSTTQIAPDIAVCKDCLREISDPQDRRYGYPFTNCTNCGPRFTIVQKIPYDRSFTSMAPFTMCEDCEREYTDPLNRRFHAQPNACPICGPTLAWCNQKGEALQESEQSGQSNQDCLRAAAQALAEENIVAIRGLGGFHLAVDAFSPQAIETLRVRKNRPDKPFAMMVKNLETAHALANISPLEAEQLCSSEAPIVLLERRSAGDSATLPENLAPGLGHIGIMLPATPLHFLLFQQENAPVALVMTSGNPSGEPLCIGNKEAVERLGHIADFFLLHNREILTRVDDSVVRIMAGKCRVMRRARGFTPVPLPLAHTTEDALACGAEMKSTFCLVRNQEACLSQHIGELVNKETLDFYRESVNHLQDVLQSHPTRILADQHPDYLSTRFARQRVDAPAVPLSVQHHHAHALAVMAEHGLDQPCLALLLDGTGYSGSASDTSIYGGEVYRVERQDFVRLGHIRPFLLPGGDMAAKEPWRMALSLLHAAFSALENGDKQITQITQRVPGIDPAKISIIRQMMESQINCPSSSSCGRVFDGIPALLGICVQISYEGQAAMLMEEWARKTTESQSLLDKPREDHNRRGHNFPIQVTRNAAGLSILDWHPMVQALVVEVLQLQAEPPEPIQGTKNTGAQLSPVQVGRLSREFHSWLIDSLLTMVEQVYDALPKQSPIVLSGGCMQNKLLFEGLFYTLNKAGYTVFSGENVPVNDGGIALGQAYCTIRQD